MVFVDVCFLYKTIYWELFLLSSYFCVDSRTEEKERSCKQSASLRIVGVAFEMTVQTQAITPIVPIPYQSNTNLLYKQKNEKKSLGRKFINKIGRGGTEFFLSHRFQ